MVIFVIITSVEKVWLSDSFRPGYLPSTLPVIGKNHTDVLLLESFERTTSTTTFLSYNCLMIQWLCTDKQTRTDECVDSQTNKQSCHSKLTIEVATKKSYKQS